MPGDSTYEIGMLANADAYVSDTIGGTGHIRVNVTPSGVKVDFVRAYLPADTLDGSHHNREVAFSYQTGNSSNSANLFRNSDLIKVFPNPASNKLTIILPEDQEKVQISLFNASGQKLTETPLKEIDIMNIPDGIYFLKIRTENYQLNKKIMIER